MFLFLIDIDNWQVLNLGFTRVTRDTQVSKLRGSGKIVEEKA